jgi:hypothetical protein
LATNEGAATNCTNYTNAPRIIRAIREIREIRGRSFRFPSGAYLLSLPEPGRLRSPLESPGFVDAALSALRMVALQLPINYIGWGVLERIPKH